jgi:glycosyltransferase involved in cell wall biosynthesis
MLASVIICSFNRSKLLEASLRSVIKQDFQSDKFEIILVDNNSSDDTRATVEKIASMSPVKITYLLEMKQGLSYARNAGIIASRGEILVFTDDDIRAEESWLRNLVSVFDAPEVAGAGGPLKPAWPFERPAWLTDDMLPAIAVSEFPTACDTGEFKGPDYPWGANIAFRRDVFEYAGMFPINLGRIDTNLLSNEELEICRKIEARGLRIRFAPNAVIHHKIAPDRLKKIWFLHRYYWQGRSDAILDSATGIDIYKRLLQRVKDMAWRLSKEGDQFIHACQNRSDLGYFHQLILAPDERAIPFRTLRAIEMFVNGMTGASKSKDDKLQEMSKYIDEKHLDLSTYDKLIQEKNRQLVNLEGIKTEQKQQIDDMAAKIQVLDDMVMTTQAHLTEQLQLVSNLNGIIINSQHQISQLELRSNEREDLLFKFRAENVRLQSELDLANNKFEELYDSWSWKITSPLRKIVDLTIKLRGK